jgi:uncharacterized protein
LKKIETSEVEVVETQTADLDSPILILGFVGAGLASQIAANHVIDQLGMKEIAHVRSRAMPPTVVFIDGTLKHPFRIYADKMGKMCIAVCDIPLPSESLYPIAESILNWADEKGVNELVVLEGIPLKGLPRKRQSFCAAEPEKRKECERKGVKMLSAKVIIHGLAGSVLTECLTHKITGVAFLTPAVAFLPDPEGAAELIKTLNIVYNLNIETTDLLNQANAIQQKVKEVAESYQKIKKAEDKRGSPERLYI